MNKKLILLAFLITLFTFPVSADNIIIDNTGGLVLFKPANTAGYINLANGYFSSITTTADDLILNGTIKLNSSADITISQFNSIARSFNASATSGTMKLAFYLAQNAIASLLVDSVAVGSKVQTDSNGWVYFSYTGWSEHSFSFDTDTVSIPTIISPTANQIIGINYHNSTWTASTNTNHPSDTIYYTYQFSNVSNFGINLTQGITTNQNINLTLPLGINYFRLRANNSYHTSNWTSTVPFFIGTSELYTPPNNSVFNIVYPILTDNIDFLWSLPSGYASNLQVARDVDFNTIVYDGVLANNSHMLALGAGTYKWRVRFYNIASATYYNWGSAFNFSVVSQQPTLDSTSIYGVVNKLVNNVQTPISGAEVRLWNNQSTVSYSTITGSNGYFVFSNLANLSTFFLQAKKSDEYDDSSIEIVTTGNGTKTEKNILMVGCTIAYNCFVNQKSVRFTVRWLYCISNCNIPGVLISIYDGNAVLASYSGTTDSTGTYKTTLLKDVLYRLTAINSTLGISKEMTFYPDDETYIITISNTNTETGTKYPLQEKDGIKINITKNQINNVSASITVNYTDNLALTTGLIIYLNRTNLSNPTVPIIVDSFSAGSGNQSHTFNISNYESDYFLHIIATHGIYGTIDRTYAITFLRNLVDTNGIPSQLWMWFGVILMFFTGAVFSKSTSEAGLIIVCGEGWIFLVVGAFSYMDSIPNVGQTKFGIGLTIATILAFLAHFKKSNQEAGYT